MRVSGLDDNEIDNYSSVMLTEKEMRPYIEGAKQQGYRIGHQEGFKRASRTVWRKARPKVGLRVKLKAKPRVAMQP